MKTAIEILKDFIIESVCKDKLLELNAGVYRFRGSHIVDGYHREDNTKRGRSDYAVWDYLGEPRLIDYQAEDAFQRSFGDWPIITDIKWSDEIVDGIVITTKPWEYEDKEYGRSFEEEE